MKHFVPLTKLSGWRHFCFSELVFVVCPTQKWIKPFFIDHQHQNISFTSTPPFIDSSKTQEIQKSLFWPFRMTPTTGRFLYIMGLPKYLMCFRIVAMAVNCTFSTDLGGICPVQLQQNPAVPWIGRLDPNVTMFAPTGGVAIGHLLNFSFVRSPNLEVCVLYIYVNMRQMIISCS